MNAAEVPEEWVEAAVKERYDFAREGGGTEWADLPPASRAYVMRRHEAYMRHALAAVLPEAQAQARREAERERDAALVERDEMRRMALSVSQSARRIASSPRLRAAETERTS